MTSWGEASTAALWSAVLVSGVYHGVNPGMGWPLAVSAALMERRRRAMATALGSLAVGHLLAMAVVLVPFVALDALLAWQRPVRLVSSALVVAAGTYLLVNRRHPRFLARVPPHRLVLWSFLVATAHGAGLMLLPVALALRTDGAGGAAGPGAGHDMTGHGAAGVGEGVGQALLVAGVHTLAMVTAGAVLAVAVHAWLGLRAVSRSWFDLDVVWALSLVVVGSVSGVLAAVS